MSAVTAPAYVAHHLVDPYRSTRWRYDRAMYVVNTRRRRQQPVKGVDDEHVVTLYRFLRDWQLHGRSNAAASREARLAHVFPKYPALFLAYEMFNREDDPLRTTVEARILAGQDDQDIAARAGTDPGAVEWYERAFFNVRDRLGYKDYINSNVIGPVMGTGLETISYSLLTKFFAYFAGPVFLDFILYSFDPDMPPYQSGTDLNRYLDRFFGTTLRRRSLDTAMVTNEFNRFNMTDLFQLHTNLIIEARMVSRGTGAATPFEQIVTAIMGAIPWSVGKGRRQQLAASPLGPYMPGSTAEHQAEPRVSEMFSISRGTAPPELADIAQRKLPPPRKKDEEPHGKSDQTV